MDLLGYGMHGIKLHLYAVHAIHEMHQVVLRKISCIVLSYHSKIKEEKLQWFNQALPQYNIPLL